MKNFPAAPAALALLGVACGTWAQAAEAPADNDSREPATALDAVTVVERARPAPAAHLTTLTAEDLAASPARRIDDILLEAPAFGLFRRASSRVANPTSQGVTLRAIAPSGTSRSLVLLDGVPLNDPFGGWVYWNRVPMLSVDTVEIASGGLSSAWGSAALSGTVVLTTNEAGGTVAEVGSGSRDQREAAVVTQTPLGGGSLAGGLQYASSKGYPVVAPEQAGAIDVPAFAQYRSGWGGWSQDTASASWSVKGGVFAETRGNGTPLTGNNTDISWLQGRVQWGAADSQWEVLLYGQDQEFASTFSSQADDRNSETPALDQFSVPATALGGALRWQHAQGSAGLDWRVLDGETNERYFYSEGDFVNQRKAGAGQQFAGAWKQYAWHSGGWSVQGSGRVDWVRTDAAFRREWNRSSGETRTDENYPDREDWEFSPRVDVVRELDRTHRLRFAAWRSFRAPTINERVRPFRVRNDITAANPALENEHLTGVDVGWSWQGAQAQGQLTLFWSRLDDAVANVTLTTEPGFNPVCGFVPGGGSCRQRQNLERITAQGLEWDVGWQPHADWQLGLAILIADNTVDAGPVELVGKDVAQVPGLRASLSVRHRGWVHSNLRLRHVAAQFDDDQNTRELAAYTTLDIGLSRELQPGVTFALSAENLLDEDFAVAEAGNGLLTTGMPRLLYASLRLALD